MISERTGNYIKRYLKALAPKEDSDVLLQWLSDALFGNKGMGAGTESVTIFRKITSIQTSEWIRAASSITDLLWLNCEIDHYCFDIIMDGDLEDADYLPMRYDASANTLYYLYCNEQGIGIHAKLVHNPKYREFIQKML